MINYVLFALCTNLVLAGSGSNVGEDVAALETRLSADLTTKDVASLPNRVELDETVLQRGVEDILEGVEGTVHYFSKNNLSAGMLRLGEAFLPFVSSLVPEEDDASSYDAFYKECQDVFESDFALTSTTVAKVQTYLTYREKELTAFLVNKVSDQISLIALDRLPRSSAFNVVKYMDAIVYTFDARSEYREEEVKTGDNETVFANDDGPEACWRIFRQPMRRRPHVCRTGYVYDGERSCYPVVERLLRSNNANMDKTTGGKRNRRRARRNRAVCDSSTPFKHRRGNWCYGGCPRGYREVPGKKQRECFAPCPSAYPHKTKLMCGETASEIAAVALDVSVTTLENGLTIGESIRSMAANGVSAGDMISTIVGFLQISSSLVYPACHVD